MNGCVVASGCCMPSAADEEWHSTKRPYSTVAVHHYRAKYHFGIQLLKVYFWYTKWDHSEIRHFVDITNTQPTGVMMSYYTVAQNICN